MSAPISEIKGVEPEIKNKLEAEGIRNTGQFLEHAHTAKQRTELAHKIGVSQVVIKELANRADLMRLSGVGSVYSDLLEEAGVNSCKELQHRTPENLLNTLEKLKTSKKLPQHVPTLAQIQQWIGESKGFAATSPE